MMHKVMLQWVGRMPPPGRPMLCALHTATPMSSETDAVPPADDNTSQQPTSRRYPMMPPPVMPSRRQSWVLADPSPKAPPTQLVAPDPQPPQSQPAKPTSIEDALRRRMQGKGPLSQSAAPDQPPTQPPQPPTQSQPAKPASIEDTLRRRMSGRISRPSWGPIHEPNASLSAAGEGGTEAQQQQQQIQASYAQLLHTKLNALGLSHGRVDTNYNEDDEYSPMHDDPMPTMPSTASDRSESLCNAPAWPVGQQQATATPSWRSPLSKHGNPRARHTEKLSQYATYLRTMLQKQVRLDFQGNPDDDDDRTPLMPPLGQPPSWGTSHATTEADSFSSPWHGPLSSSWALEESASPWQTGQPAPWLGSMPTSPQSSTLTRRAPARPFASVNGEYDLDMAAERSQLAPVVLCLCEPSQTLWMSELQTALTKHHSHAVVMHVPTQRPVNESQGPSMGNASPVLLQLGEFRHPSLFVLIDGQLTAVQHFANSKQMQVCAFVCVHASFA